MNDININNNKIEYEYKTKKNKLNKKMIFDYIVRISIFKTS